MNDYDPESPIATALRRLYKNIRVRKTVKEEYKSFLITSSSRGEGKSTIASHLALTIAQRPKQSVLVVDADLRRPQLHKLFGLPNSSGLRDCLESDIDPMEAVRDTGLPNLKVITAGPPTDAASHLFESDTLQVFFEKAHFYFDIVLVDSPPVVAVSDTLFLCPLVDAVLFVLLVGDTPSGVVMRAKNILDDAGAEIAGVVANNALDVLPAYYGYRYYGYSNYGRSDD